MTAADSEIVASVRGEFFGAPPERLAVAVSGGGDSVAMLHILTRCFDPGRVTLYAATVDHGLRPEAAAEAAAVGDLARSLGITHEVLRWRGWDGAGNLQDRARRARYGMLTGWARQHGIAMLALGHTADDQAETVLMRLARAPGVTGLAGIPARRSQDGIALIRPVLGLSRAALRDYLRRNGIAWVDDPSNEDDRFDRIRARRALSVLAPLGITVAGLAEVAQNMAQARDALDWYSFLAARDIVTCDAGDLIFDLRGFRVLPAEIARRLLVRAILWISGGEYPPRRVPLAAALNVIRSGGSVTLGGCVVMRQGQSARIFREHAAVQELRGRPGEIWDRRWRLIGDGDAAGCEVRALGRHALGACPDWRATGRPQASLAATPAIWRDDDLVAAPMAGLGNGWRAELVGNREEFLASFLSH